MDACPAHPSPIATPPPHPPPRGGGRSCRWLWIPGPALCFAAIRNDDCDYVLDPRPFVLAVADGSSPKRERYACAKRPRCEKPVSSATLVTPALSSTSPLC